MLNEIKFKPIGIIHTKFKTLENMPIQPTSAQGIKGEIDLYPEYKDGLKDLDGFSHIVLLYFLHRSKEFKLEVTPFLDTQKRGLFATRAPKRPNSIGLSVVKLNSIEGGRLHIENVDILDGTPLLDIKPYVPEFDRHVDIKTGWLEKAKSKIKEKKSDSRFI